MADGVRLDKWLWAARFFRTRSLARAAIDGGKVHVDGQRGKPSKELRGGEEVRCRRGYDEVTVIVTALSDQRRGAAEAAELYRETAESISQREKVAAERRAARAGLELPERRPDKRQRRLIHRFRRDLGEE